MLAALAGVLTLPAGAAVAQRTKRVELLDVAYAIPLAAAFGLLAIALSVGARRRIEWTVGRVGGAGLARAGRLLGVLAVCLAVAGAIAVGVFEVLRRIR